MSKKFAKVLLLTLSMLGAQSCNIPGASPTAISQFPTSVTETHTKTTVVHPMSYGNSNQALTPANSTATPEVTKE